MLGPIATLGGPDEDLDIEGDPADPSNYPPINPPGTQPIPREVPPIPNIEIIDTVPPRPGGVGIGGGVDPRVTTYGWKFNHAPVDGLQSSNGTWWQLQAERYNSTIAGPGGNLYGRQSIQKALKRRVYSGKTTRLKIDFSGDF